MAKYKDIVVIDTTKDKSDIILQLTIAPELEEFFKEMAVKSYGSKEEEYVQTSTKWLDADGNGLRFYKNNKSLQESIKKYIDGRFQASSSSGNYLTVSNDFGKGLFEDGSRINIAILRVAGASKGVSIRTTDLIAFEEIKLYVEQLAVFVKEFYSNFMKKQQIKARISFEV